MYLIRIQKSQQLSRAKAKAEKSFWSTNNLERSERVSERAWSINSLERSDRLTERVWSNYLERSERLIKKVWSTKYLKRSERLILLVKETVRFLNSLERSERLKKSLDHLFPRAKREAKKRF